MGDTTISWTNKTWNPLVGCEYASEGCTGCYAAREAFGRLKSNLTYTGLATKEGDALPRFTGEIRLLDDRLDQPLSWRGDRYMVFVNSMSDLFHRDVPDEYIAEVYVRMAIAGHLTFQVLTKRPQRAARLLASDRFRAMWWRLRDRRAGRPDVQRLWAHSDDQGWPSGSAIIWPPPNVGLGTSIELDKYVAPRVRALTRPGAAAWRFLSVEPLLGPVDLPFARDGVPSDEIGSGEAIDWVIVGGESGPRSHPMHPDWVRTLRDQCAAARVPFHFKQWGMYAPTTDETYDDQRSIALTRAGDILPAMHTPVDDPDDEGIEFMDTYTSAKAAGRVLDGRTHDAGPPIVQAGIPLRYARRRTVTA